MQELVRTNDMVLISFIEALLTEAGIHYLVLDQNVSAVEGSIGIIPRRILVDEDDLPQAAEIMIRAGVGRELRGRP